MSKCKPASDLYEYLTTEFPGYEDMVDGEFCHCPLDSVVGQSCVKAVEKTQELIELLDCCTEHSAALVQMVINHCECEYFG